VESTVRIIPYTEELEPEVRRFNQRLHANGETQWRFPESHIPQFPKLGGRVPYQEYFVAVQAGAVRGGYLLTHNQFAVRGEQVGVACGPHYNVSEGLIDRTYAMLGVIQTQDALRRQPLMYALGMAGLERPLTKLLSAMEWVVFPVPFYFRIVSSPRFFENITYLRKDPLKRVALDLLYYSGLGPLGVRVAQTRIRPATNLKRGTVVDSFGTWADEIWEQCRCRYSLVGMRTAYTLNAFYPPQDSRFVRLRVSSDGHDIGWVVMLDSQMQDHRQFGNMRVGSIIDCFGAPEDAAYVINCATDFLQRRGVDILITNQASSSWCSALAANGYLKGPSNFILALSPQLAERLLPVKYHAAHIHMNRGDGGSPAVLPLLPTAAQSVSRT
jgi:hypothetical protein